MKIKITCSSILISSLLFLGSTVFAAPDVNNNIKVTANATAGCFLSSENIDFGILTMPLPTDSVANGALNVLCSKNASFTVNLAYGGIYGADQKGNYYLGESFVFNSSGNTYGIYSTSTGNMIGVILCTAWYSVFENQAIASIYGATPNKPNYEEKGCTSGRLNTDYFRSIGGIIPYDYGVLTGATTNDTIKYRIYQIDSSYLIWTSNTPKTIIATGMTQKLNLGAHIKKNDNTNATFLTPDTYSDIITMSITY